MGYLREVLTPGLRRTFTYRLKDRYVFAFAKPDFKEARDSDVKVELASGSIEGEAIETLHGLHPTGFIQKPFDLQALTRSVDRTLG